MCVVLLPYVSAAFWLEGSNRSLNQLDFQPWAMLLFTASGILYIAFYALWGFIPGTQPSEEDTRGGRHAAQRAAHPQHAQQHRARPQHAQPQHARPQRTQAAGAHASGAATRGSATTDETAQFPVFNPETREFPSTEGYTDIPAPPSYGGRHALDND